MNNSDVIFEVISDGKPVTVHAEPGETVLEALRRNGAPAPHAPCAGRGRCGQCRVVLESGGAPEFHADEMAALKPGDREAGVRLACRLPAVAGMRLRVEKGGKARIETRAEGLEEDFDPVLVRSSVVLPAGSLEDQRPASARLEEALDLEPGSLPAALVRSLPAIPDGETALSVVMEDDRPVALDTDTGTEESILAAAVDIGTTTVAMYLVDLSDGSVSDSEAELNAQSPFGADVISRLEHTRKGSAEAGELQRTIVGQLQGMLETLVRRAGAEKRNLHLLAAAGNTAMMHLLAGWDAAGLGEAPFLPAALEAPSFAAGEIGFSGFPRLRISILPSLSAYVGADITAGMVASGMKDRDGTDLLLDIGTNGEMALGGSGGILCCSTAAGPAFEGAHLSSGSGSIPGAVDHVDWNEGRFSYTTIDDLPPLGFCGSGVVDLAAFLVRSGLMDETGRFVEEITPDQAAAFGGLELEQGDTGPVFSWPDGRGKRLGFTQKDLREVQLAKAAIRAGIDTLLSHSGKTAEDIGTLWLAGGFGSYIRPESAAAIGLIPPQLAGKTRSLGNAAARGALLSLLSKSRRRDAVELAREASAIELSGRPEFQDAYIEAMMFPSREEEG